MRELSSAKDRCAGEIRSDPGRRDGRPAGSLSRREDASGAVSYTHLDVYKRQGERERELRQIYEAAGYSVYFTSANDQESVSMVRELLKGKTTALAGPSGVGKSSLTNQIQPEAAMETGAISEKIRRGRHTTRHSRCV